MKINRTLSRVFAPAAGVVLVAGFVAACGSSSDNPATLSSFDQVAVTNPHPDSDLKEGGNVNWPISQWIANWNYNQPDGTTVDMGQIRQALLPQAFTAAPDGSVSVDKRYFTDISLSTKDGKNVVTYDINPKAKWSTGRAVDWTDLEAQWKALNGKNTEYQAASTTGYEDVESVTRGANDQQAIVTYGTTFGDWKSLFSPLEAREVNESPEAFNTGYASKPIPTAGPFRIKNVDAGSKRIVAERNPDWWGDKPHLDTITYIALDSTATVGALQNGEIDWADLGSNIDGFKVARGLPGIDIRQSAGFQWRHWDFNGAAGRPTADVKVRLALQKAVNRDVIAKALMGQITSTPTVLNNHVYVDGEKGYQANNGDITYDVAAANKLLDDDGWVKQGEFRKKDGKQLDITQVIPSETPNSLQETQLIQQDLKKIGVNLIIKTVPSDGFFDDYIHKGLWDTTIYTWEGTQFPASSTKSIYYLDPKNKGQNDGQIGSEEINQKFDQLLAETDDTKKIQLANEIDKLIFQTGHSLPLYQRPYSFATKKELANFGAPGFGDIYVEKIGWLK